MSDRDDDYDRAWRRWKWMLLLGALIVGLLLGWCYSSRTTASSILPPGTDDSKAAYLDLFSQAKDFCAKITTPP